VNFRGGKSARGGGRSRSRDAGPDEGAIISEVQPDAAKPGCIAVRIRGHKPLRIDDTDEIGRELAKGVKLDASLLARLVQAAANCKARLKLQSRLAVRPLSRMEASLLLRRAGAESEFSKSVIARFEQLGWINDERLAESVAASEAARPVGRMRVVARVARRGINSGQARKSADAAVSSRRETQAELAVIAATSQLRKLPPALDDPTRRRRLLGFLARRGFDEHTARQAIVNVMGRPGRGEAG